MDIAFRTRKLERAFNSVTALQKTYGAQMSKIIMMRMAVLKAARNLASVPTTRPVEAAPAQWQSRRAVRGRSLSPPPTRFRTQSQAASAQRRWRIDTEQVTAITILDVIDYH